MASNHRKPGIHIAWTTISYRSVALLMLAFAAVAFLCLRLAFRQFTQKALQKAGDVTSRVLEKVAGMAPATATGVVTARQAHLTALDGGVGGKKGNGNTRVAADYHISVEKGDVVQTASTQNYSQAVPYDPKADQHEILLKKGTGEVAPNGETEQLASRENVSIQGERSHLEKATKIGPTTLIAPANMAPRFSNGAPAEDVEFSSTPMRNAVGYGLRVSRNPYFSSTLVDKKVNTAAVTVTKLGDGFDDRMVKSSDASGKSRWRTRRTASISCPPALRPKRLSWNPIPSSSLDTRGQAGRNRDYGNGAGWSGTEHKKDCDFSEEAS